MKQAESEKLTHIVSVIKVEKAQVKILTLMMATFSLGLLVLGLLFCACSLTDMTYWDI